MREILSDRMKRKAALYALGVLVADELKSFEKMVKASSQLRAYVDELSSTLKATSRLTKREPSDAFLRRQRTLLRGRIDMASSRPISLGWSGKVRNAMNAMADFILFPRRPALAAISFLLLGLLVGRFLLLPRAKAPAGAPMTTEEKIRRIMEAGQLEASQIQYIPNGSDRVIFQLKTEDEFTYSAGFRDELAKELLAYVILNEPNPGKRLRSIKLTSEFTADDELKMVLVAAVLTDENPGIRLRAIKRLANYPQDKIIWDASMKTLLEDENTAVRMEALSILSQNANEKLLPVLQVVSRLDENEFIREQAAAVLDQLAETMKTRSNELIR